MSVLYRYMLAKYLEEESRDMNEVKLSFIFGILCSLYKQWIRTILLRAVDDPNADWDDWLMKFADRVFKYGGQENGII